MFALTLDCWDRPGQVKVRHIFYGRSEEECRELAENEMSEDGYLAEADEAGRVGEFVEPISCNDVPNSSDYDDDVVDAEIVEGDV